MIVRKNMLSFFVLWCCLLAGAQEPSKKNTQKFSFHSINQLGLLQGESGSDVLFQSINGAAYKSWFAGIGVGIDGYLYSSIPLFVDVRKHLKNTPSSFFVYADGGVALPFNKKTNNDFRVAREYHSGLYYDAGLGYHFSLQKNEAVVVSIGYTQKNVVREDKGASFFVGDGPQYVIRREYQLKRLSFKIGFVF